MKAIVYKITCLTNLHVGNGESNFDIIDNAVERDPVTELPTINSSGVKGAFRQYFKDHGAEEDVITSIFGTDPKSFQKEGRSKSYPGRVKFYQADLLSRPARASRGDHTNYMVTSEEAVGIYNIKAMIFGTAKIDLVDSRSNTQIAVEGVEHLYVQDISAISDQTIILSDRVLRDLPLPVLARNQLDNGISQNLWYEQVVPHKSIFTFAVSSDDDKALKMFDALLGKSAYVQFGGNASIGYGLCKVEKMEAKHE